MASFESGFRIATNIGAMNAYNALNNINQELQTAQLQLATGKRINSAGDDPAGYTIGTKLQARSAGLSQALTNVGDAQSVLSTAEGGLQAINNILINIKTLVTEAGNAGLSSAELSAISTQVKDYMTEIDQTIQQTKFNGTQLLSGTAESFSSVTLASAGLTGGFQVGADNGDFLTVDLTTANTTLASSADVGSKTLLDTVYTTLNGYATGTTTGSISSTDMGTMLNGVDNAISNVSSVLQYVGSLESRLSFKEQVLSTSITNVQAATSRIMDADIAQVQVNATKLQILEQTATVQLAQANSTPSGILRLFQ